jgi:hypothetical protein
MGTCFLDMIVAASATVVLLMFVDVSALFLPVVSFPSDDDGLEEVLLVSLLLQLMHRKVAATKKKFFISYLLVRK